MDVIDRVGHGTRVSNAAETRIGLDWLFGMGVGALGLLIGFVLGIAAAPSSVSSLPRMDRALADQASTAKRVDAGVPPGVAPGPDPIPHHREAPAHPAVAQTQSPGPAASWTAPLLPSTGFEPCWAVLEAVNC